VAFYLLRNALDCGFQLPYVAEPLVLNTYLRERLKLTLFEHYIIFVVCNIVRDVCFIRMKTCSLKNSKIHPKLKQNLLGK